MSDDEVCRVLEVVRRDARCPSVSFTGGEPTLRPGLPRFVRHAKGLGLKVNLISNGQRLDEERVAGARRAPASTRPSSRSRDRPRRSTTRSSAGRVRSSASGPGVERLRARGVRVHTNTTL